MNTNRINYGWPAFPTLEEHGFNSGEPGMTLRDYFAAKALLGLLSDGSIRDKPEGFAKSAYEVADAMLKERDKTLDQS